MLELNGGLCMESKLFSILFPVVLFFMLVTGIEIINSKLLPLSGANEALDTSKIENLYVIPVSLGKKDENLQSIAFVGMKEENRQEAFGKSVKFQNLVSILRLKDEALDAFEQQTFGLFGSSNTLKSKNAYFFVVPDNQNRASAWFFVEVPYIPSALFGQTLSWLSSTIYQGKVSIDLLTNGFTNFGWTSFSEFPKRFGSALEKPVSQYSANLSSQNYAEWRKFVGAPPTFASAIKSVDDRIRASMPGAPSDQALRAVIGGSSVPAPILNELKKAGLMGEMAPNVLKNVKGLVMRGAHKGKLLERKRATQ